MQTTVTSSPLTLHLGAAQAVTLASPPVLDAFFATVSYRLEPDGWGTRFPITLDYLHAGRLGPAEAAAAQAELETIARELRALPARKAVWDYQDTRPRAVPPGFPGVNPAAENLDAYFVAADDGRTPLVERLRELAVACRERGQTLRLATSEGRKQLKGALFVLGFGLLLGTAGLLWFPHYILSNHGSKSGPLIWAVGYLIAGFGVWMTLEARSPALAAMRRRHSWLATFVGAAVTLAVFIAAWR
ncbi:MAG: hypothetical protein JO295_07410 [Verrucomicrobia bacterium]|nr:hypothetical protein [Verrucomicrobiota bacterium]